MRIIRYLLLTIVFFSMFCILEPYEVIDEQGICYRGYDEYKELIREAADRIEVVSFHPDTIIVDTSEKKIEFDCVCRIDTAFYKYGTYKIYGRYTSLVRPELVDSSGYDDNENYRFSDVLIDLDTERNNLSSASDTFTIVISYSIGCCSRSDSDTSYRQIETAAFRIEYCISRYVDKNYCSLYNISTSEPVIAIVRRQYE